MNDADDGSWNYKVQLLCGESSKCPLSSSGDTGGGLVHSDSDCCQHDGLCGGERWDALHNVPTLHPRGRGHSVLELLSPVFGSVYHELLEREETIHMNNNDAGMHYIKSLLYKILLCIACSTHNIMFNEIVLLIKSFIALLSRLSLAALTFILLCIVLWQNTTTYWTSQLLWLLVLFRSIHKNCVLLAHQTTNYLYIHISTCCSLV